jgi:hypothetical protein
MAEELGWSDRGKWGESARDVWARLVEEYAVDEDLLESETKGLSGDALLDQLCFIERIVQPLVINVNGVRITPSFEEQMASLRQLARPRQRRPRSTDGREQ